MRTLTTAAAAQAIAQSTAPNYILKIEFGGAVGTKYYSTLAIGAGTGGTLLTAENRALTFGNIDQATREDGQNPVGSMQIDLRDGDGVLRGYDTSVGIVGKRATVYLWFTGTQATDAVIVMSGIIDDPVKWSLAQGTLSVNIVDISKLYQKTIGVLATREGYPSVANEDEGKMFPIVFGKARYVPAIQAVSGLTTKLARICGPSDATLYVEDAESMPQDTPCQIWVERELVSGQFHGNRFFVTARGCRILTSHATADPPGNGEIPHFWWKLVDSTLTGTCDDYEGYDIEVKAPDGKWYRPTIECYIAALHELWFSPVISQSGVYWYVPSGSLYRIISQPSLHIAGSAVSLKQTNYVYVVNARPSKKVRYVRGHGTIVQNQWTQLNPNSIASAPYSVNTYVTIASDMYTVNLNDATSFPALGACTTISFKKPPKLFRQELSDNALWADVDGLESVGDGSGTLLENPSDLIKAVLTQLLGVVSGDIDATSFSSVVAGLAYLKFAGVLERQTDSLQLVADLAFQARCALLWDDGKARLRRLTNIAETSLATVHNAQRQIVPLDDERSPRDDIISEVTATWRHEDKQGSVTVRDATVALAHDKTWPLNLWAYSKRAYAVQIAEFWLERRKRTVKKFAVRSLLPVLPLQRLDPVALDMPGLCGANQAALVTDIRHDCGQGAQRATAVDVRGRLVELTSCVQGETGEVISCWTCETSCEFTCELGCMTTSEQPCGETVCNFSCETGGEGGCQTGCETGCQTGCESHCESSCQTHCETGCQTHCETGCQTHCETGCQTHCETGCQVTCQTGCETACETGCQTSCQTGCQTHCETGCQTHCETGCQTHCQTGCETSVECGHNIGDTFTHQGDDTTLVSPPWYHQHLADTVHAVYHLANSCGFPRRSSAPPDYAGTSYTFSPYRMCSANHWVILSSPSDFAQYDFVGARCRVPSISTYGGYVGTIYYGGGTTWYAGLWVEAGDGSRALLGVTSPAAQPGSIGVQANGSAISLICNSVIVLSVTDTTYPSGFLGGMILVAYPGESNWGLEIDGWSMRDDELL